MKYYRPEDIAEILTLHPATIRKWIRQGKLKAVKLGKVWRVTEEDLRVFLKQDQSQVSET